MIIAMEPHEGLRYLSYLKPDGILVTSSEPFVNMSNYPETGKLHSSIKKLPKHKIIQTAVLAKEAGLAKAANTVMVGAASCYLPVKGASLEKIIADTFAKKDAAVVTANTKAFKLGKTACSQASVKSAK